MAIDCHYGTELFVTASGRDGCTSLHTSLLLLLIFQIYFIKEMSSSSSETTTLLPSHSKSQSTKKFQHARGSIFRPDTLLSIYFHKYSPLFHFAQTFSQIAIYLSEYLPMQLKGIPNTKRVRTSVLCAKVFANNCLLYLLSSIL